MKKGLLSLLVVALTVVGCQDYDDQFDSLNKEILALKADLSTITGLQTSVTAISTEITKLMAQGSATDVELAKVLTDISLVKTAVNAIDVTGIDDVVAQTADLNAEIDTIMEKLTKLTALTGGTYAGPLNIKSLVQLDAAEDIVDSSEDGPLMTITGDIHITAGQTDLKLAANLLRIQAILSKLKVVTGAVTITGVDIAMTADELLFVTGSLNIVGKSSMALPKLNTVDGAVDLGLYGPLSYPLLTSVTSLELSGNTASITTVDFSGLTTGIVTTGQSSLVLPASVSVMVGSLPVSVTLAKAVTVQAHGVDNATDLSISAPKATELIIKAAKHTGQVTIVANLAAVTLETTEVGSTAIHALSVTADKLKKIRAAGLGATISATTFSAAVLKDVAATLTLVSIATADLPTLATLTASFTGAKVATFTAPKLSVSATASRLIDLKAGATVTVKTIGHLDALTDSNTIAGLTVTAQANDIVLDNMVKLATLEYTSSVIAGTLTISTTMVSLTTLTLGQTSKLTTLTVSATNMVTLGTAGVILNTNVVNNAKLTTLSFGHTHLDGQLATTVDIVNNDVLLALDMSSLGKVKEVEVTGNASLTTFTAPSVTNKAEPTVSVVVTMTGNAITGTYSKTISGTETTPTITTSATSAAITSWKVFIDGYNLTQNASVTYNLDIDKLLLGSSTDGKYNDGAYSTTSVTTVAASTAVNGTISTTVQLDQF